MRNFARTYLYDAPRFGFHSVYAATVGLIILSMIVLGYTWAYWLLVVFSMSHRYVGLWRGSKKDPLEFPRDLLLFGVCAAPLLFVSKVDFIFVTFLFFYFHYVLDMHFLNDNRLQRGSYVLIGTFLVFQIYPFLSIGNSDFHIHQWMILFSAIGIGLLIWDVRLNRRLTPSAVELAALNLLFVVFALAGQVELLRNFYVILGTFHGVAWFFAVDRHLFKEASLAPLSDRPERMERWVRYRIQSILALVLFAIAAAVYSLLPRYGSVMDFLFRTDYFSAWTTAHVLGTFRLSRLKKMIG